MEEIVQKLDELKNIIENNSIPKCLEILGVIVPIIISLVVFGVSSHQFSINKKLQTQISNRDIKAQMHTNFLKMYDDIAFAQNLVGTSGKRCEKILANFDVNSYFITAPAWVSSLANSAGNLCQASNRVKIFLSDEDKEFKNIIINIWKKYEQLIIKISSYYYDGKANYNAQNAWDKINKIYGIPQWTYAGFIANYKAYEDYINLCTNDETQEINKLIEEFLKLFDYDKFDVYFEKYLRIDTE